LLVAVLIVGILIVGAYFYFHGSGSHGSLPDTSGAQAQAQDFWSTVQHDPRFYTAVGAAITAAALMYGWKRIGNVGRYSLLIAFGIALAITFGGGHK
jgi:hypothetical protein